MNGIRATLLIALSLLLANAPLAAAPERRIEGTVLGAKATYCESRAGCTGTLTLELPRSDEVLAIRVPLGTALAISAKDAPPQRGC